MNWSDKAYARFLLFVGGLGGFLYGIDVGAIAVAQPYLKNLDVYSSSQLGFIVSGVLAGGIIASLLAGVLCNRFGRKMPEPYGKGRQYAFFETKKIPVDFLQNEE